MSYAQDMDDGSQRSLDRARVVRGDRLVNATPEVLADVAENAMLLSQGAHRAIEMKREAGEAANSGVSALAGRAT